MVRWGPVGSRCGPVGSGGVFSHTHVLGFSQDGCGLHRSINIRYKFCCCLFNNIIYISGYKVK